MARPRKGYCNCRQTTQRTGPSTAWNHSPQHDAKWRRFDDGQQGNMPEKKRMVTPPKTKLTLTGANKKKLVDPEKVEAFGAQAQVEIQKAVWGEAKNKRGLGDEKLLPRSFKLTAAEDARINAVILRAARSLNIIPSKSEVVRAGLAALEGIPDDLFARFIGKVYGKITKGPTPRK